MIHAFCLNAGGFWWAFSWRSNGELNDKQMEEHFLLLRFCRGLFLIFFVIRNFECSP